MHINVLVTDKILADEWPVKYVSYSRQNDFANVMVSHSPTWVLGKMQPVTWSDFVAKHPIMADIEFHEGRWLLSREADDSGWKTEKQE